MTETPECPYCGAEMTLHKCRSSIRIWYECECGSESPHISPNWAKDTEELWREKALAAAIRRAEPENRVLTLEKLAGMANKGDWKLVWMECRSIKSEKYFLTQKCMASAGKHGVWFVTPGQADDIFYAANSYNKTWRCWLRKPTAEEMEREKWVG